MNAFIIISFFKDHVASEWLPSHHGGDVRPISQRGIPVPQAQRPGAPGEIQQAHGVETIRAVFSDVLERSIDGAAARLSHKGKAPSRKDAIQTLATMVGALALARTAATPQLRDEILSAARNKLLEAPRT